MNAFEYQKWTRETAIYPHAQSKNELALAYLGLGLVGEAGEVANKIKKLIRDGTWPFGVEKEVGDVLWYVARLCDELGWNIEEIMESNKEKLSSRKERGTLSGSGDNR